MAYRNACAQKESKQALIDKQNKAISIKRQCELLGFPRSSYYTPKSVKHQFTEEEERAMQIMDATHTKHTCYGARSHSANLARCGIIMGRHRVARLMAHMGIRSTAPQPKTSEPAKYNYGRLHSALGYQTPAEWYFSGINAANMPDKYKVGIAA